MNNAPNNNNNFNINNNVGNVNDIALNHIEVNNMIHNLNVFIEEAEEIMLEDRNQAMLNMSTFDEV